MLDGGQIDTFHKTGDEIDAEEQKAQEAKAQNAEKVKSNTGNNLFGAFMMTNPWMAKKAS